MGQYSHDPYRWVLNAFDWNAGELEGYYGPDAWQAEVLIHITTQLKARETHPEQAISEVLQIAVASGNGPGKSALVAWIILWALSTLEDTRGVVTANTETQLRTKTWAELSKWHRLCITKHWLDLTATAIYSKQKAHERTWRIDQVPWSEHKTEAFAGMHNKGKRIIIIFDEASAIPDAIWEVTEGALTDKDTQILWLAFGNPTRNTGRFKECFRKLRHRWKTWQLDIRKSVLVNQEKVKEWIADMGLDSDWIRVHVLGLFPKASDTQFISTDLVEKARGRQIEQHKFNFAAKIIGVDPAWTGGDKTVIALRQGLVFRILQVFEKNDDDTLIGKAIAAWEDKEHTDAVFIDMGYGTGIYSYGKSINRTTWILVPFGGKSAIPGFANKRAEMWNGTKEWLKEGGCIPDDQELADDLTGPENRVKLNGEIFLESKEDMKARGLPSPNKADALGLTFAHPVQKKVVHQAPQFANRGAEYDPYAVPGAQPQPQNKPYDPLG